MNALISAQNLLTSIHTLRHWCKFALADRQLCPFRSIFSKSTFPSRYEIDPNQYPFFKDFQKCFKSQNGLEEEVAVVRSTLSLFNQNLFRLIRPILKDDEARSSLARIIFGILSENKAEGNLASTIRDPLGPLHVGFTQSLNITCLLLQLVKPFAGKEPDELQIVSNWCFGDARRFACFSEQSTLQPGADRNVADVVDKCDAIFDEKEQIYSTFFWLTHWAMRQGLHPITSQMNYQMQHMLAQLQKQLKEAEESGDETKKRQAEVALHYLLIKTHTLRAIIGEQGFKFTVLTFFHLSMKVLVDIAQREPKSLKNVPEFVIENINDVTGQLSRFNHDFLEDTVRIEFLHSCYKFVVLFMESPKYAFNPHLRHGSQLFDTYRVATNTEKGGQKIAVAYGRKIVVAHFYALATRSPTPAINLQFLLKLFGLKIIFADACENVQLQLPATPVC